MKGLREQFLHAAATWLGPYDATAYPNYVASLLLPHIKDTS